jgi:hypothetical protein
MSRLIILITNTQRVTVHTKEKHHSTEFVNLVLDAAHYLLQDRHM